MFVGQKSRCDAPTGQLYPIIAYPWAWNHINAGVAAFSSSIDRSSVRGIERPQKERQRMVLVLPLQTPGNSLPAYACCGAPVIAWVTENLDTEDVVARGRGGGAWAMVIACRCNRTAVDPPHGVARAPCCIPHGNNAAKPFANVFASCTSPLIRI